MNRFKLLLLMLISLSSAAQIVLPSGFPDRSPNLDVLPGFKTPPTGYGNVAFYWWNGDTLTKERLLWQLDELKNKSITGRRISFISWGRDICNLAVCCRYDNQERWKSFGVNTVCSQ